MFAGTRDIQRLSERIGRVEDADRTDTIRALIRMLAEAASREAQMARRLSVVEAQVSELYSRLVALEDAPTLTDEIESGRDDGSDQQGVAEPRRRQARVLVPRMQSHAPGRRGRRPESAMGLEW